MARESVMKRRIVIRLSALLLILNGVAGVTAAWLGWTVTTTLLDSLRQTDTAVAAQQRRLVDAVHGVAVGVDDAAQATASLSMSTTRARNAVTDATRTADNLASTFEQLSHASRVSVFGVYPLAGLIEPFQANADDFRRVSASLGETADSLTDNARDVRRVGDDLRSIYHQLTAAATEIEALQSAALIQQGRAGLELGSRLLMGIILFEAIVSALTGLALLMVTSPLHLHPPTHLSLMRPEHSESNRPTQVVEVPRHDRDEH
jgi:hypothetical protein